MNNIQIIVGETTKAEVLENKDGKLVYGKCILCDKEVWGSGVVYTSNDPTCDVKAPRENVKPLHKTCIVDFIELAREMAEAMEKHNAYRKLN